MKKSIAHINLMFYLLAELNFLFGFFVCAQNTMAGQEPCLFSETVYHTLKRKGLEGLNEIVWEGKADCRQLKEIVRELDLYQHKRYQDARILLQEKQEEFIKDFHCRTRNNSDLIEVLIPLKWEIEEYSKQLQATNHFSFAAYDASLISWLRQNEESCEWKENERDTLFGYYPFLEQIYSDKEELQSCLWKINDRSAIEKTFCNKKILKYNKGQDPVRLIENTLNILENQYIDTIDYQKVQSSVLHRCYLIGEVLTRPANDYIFKVQRSKVQPWRDCIDDINKQHKDIIYSKETTIHLFQQIDLLNDKFLKIPKGALFSLLLEAAFYSLDPYTELVWPWEMDEFNKEMFQEYVGIGVVLKKDKKDLVISDVYPDSPAFHQFLQPKDVILEIGGRSSTGMSLQAAVKSLTEPQSKDATLKVVNPATKETRSLKIQKKHIAVPTVYSFCLSDPEGSFPKIYCIKIVQFNNSTAQEYQKTVVEVEKEGMDGLIIDLRSNKGGVLSEALEIANLYSKKGVMLISQPRFGPAIYYTADKNNMDRLYPIIILVNSLTASSAEVLADILRNSASGQALLVGQNSFGKNCVQRIISLEEDTSLLKFTYAQYRLPYRNQISQSKDTVADSLDRKGLRPDVYVNLFPHENEKINDFYRLSHLYKYSSNSNKGISLYELHAIDPQMTIGYYLLSLLVR